MPIPVPVRPPGAAPDYDEDDGRDEQGFPLIPVRHDEPREPTRDPVEAPDTTTFCHP